MPFPARPRPTPHQPDAPVLILRLQFDVPKGQSQISPGQRPGNTFSSQRPSPDGAKQNSVFHGRLGRRDSRDLWRPYRARFLGIAAPRALPWAGLSFPLRGGIRNRATRKRAGQGSAISRPAASNSTPTRRASFDVAPSVRRPEGAVTNQPRATPWEHFSSDARALTGRNRIRFFTGDWDVAIAENCGALTGHASSESRLPGRCPGLACRFPFGAEFGTAQHENAPARGVPFPARPRPTPHQPDAPVLILRLQLDVPKGQSQISPGQCPHDHPHFYKVADGSARR